MTEIEPNVEPPQPDPVVYSPPAEPAPKRPIWRPIGVLLCFAASILTLLGSFMTLFRATVQFGQNSQLVLTITAWDIHAESAGRAVPAGSTPDNGAPLVFAATVLLAAALLGLLATAVPVRVGIGRANIVLAAIGAAFLAGTVWTIGMQELAWREAFGSRLAISDTDNAVSVTVGYWLLVIAAVVALASPVFAWLPARARSAREEPQTPAFGVPVPVVVHRLPDAPADKPE
jgi:hypothetical protein